MHVCNQCLYEINAEEAPINIGNQEFHAECIDSVSELVKGFLNEIAGVEENDVYFAPDIPKGKLLNAIKSYAKDVAETQVIGLYDSTFLGKAKEGILITSAGMYISKLGNMHDEILFSDINDVKLEWRKEKKKKKTIEWPVLKISTDNKDFIYDEKVKGKDLEWIYGDLESFYGFLINIKRLRDEGKIDETDKILIVEDMPKDVKLNYARIIVNMTFLDDSTIDDKELSELQILMSRLKFDAELRSIVREYISKPDIETPDLIQQMDQAAPKGSQHPLHITLLKDLIYVHRKTKDEESIFKNPFIIKIAKFFNINKEQIEVLIEACEYDELILRSDLEESDINKYGKNLAAHAGAVGIPLAAVYMSGSVVGLSAAGITSGLAGLGLGGIFGLSSMVTGIGAVLLISIGTYKGVKWVMGRSENKEKFSKKELMMMEIMKIQQNTISNLSEDINVIAIRLLDATKESQINRTLINKIRKQLTVFSNAHRVLKERGVKLEGIFNEAC